MKKIIVTSDIKKFLGQEGEFLNREDIRIFQAASNQEALALQEAERADVIVADLDSRDLSGELLCSTIRDSGELRRVSLIILHSGTEADRLRIAGCRANAFVERSAEPAMLADRMRHLMNISLRESFRAPIATGVECGSDSIMSVGYAEDISETGMLFDSEAVFAQGEILSCWFLLPDSTHIRTEAEIVRICIRATEHDPSRYGIRFRNLAEEFRAAIARYISRKRAGL